MRPQHRTGGDGTFYLDLNDEVSLRFAGPGCDPATITADEAGLVAWHMVQYDAARAAVTFAEALAAARAAYAYLTTGEEPL